MLKKLSLLKQLIVVIIAIAIVIVAVMMPVIDYNLNNIIDNQMYDQINEAQENAINYQFFPADKKVKTTYHIIYDSSTNKFTFSNFMGESNVSDLYLYVFGDDLTKLVDSEKTFIENKNSFHKDTYYYAIRLINDSQYLVTLMSSDYSKEFVSSLKNQIVYLQYGFLVFIALVLMIWVLSLISPLQKIKAYIDSIKERKPKDLNIDRKDEIGIVSNALVEMNEELSKQEMIKEEMIHNISHDLKTPIALIKTYGQSVKDDVYPYGDKNSSMDIILENADRLDHKVKSFLYLNRLDYIDGEEKELTPFDMKDLIEKVVSQMDALNEITIVTELQDVSFIGNEEHWRVAIENIIENAMRYAVSTIRITLEKDYLEIFNDGEPIDEDKKEYLFNPYVKGVKGQFGLGLSIVYKIASMYGYEVEADNKETGVSFIFKKM